MIAAARSGETEAFMWLVNRYERGIYGMVLRLLGRPDLAEDALQETFLQALKSLGSFREEAQFGTWLHRIAANVSYDL